MKNKGIKQVSARPVTFAVSHDVKRERVKGLRALLYSGKRDQSNNNNNNNKMKKQSERERGSERARMTDTFAGCTHILI